jgi:hypothetical protein
VRKRKPHRYGKQHQLIRANFARRMEGGEVFECWRCGEAITGRWDLGHVDDGSGRGVYGRWPEHRACNRATLTHIAARYGGLHGDRGSQATSTVPGTVPRDAAPKGYELADPIARERWREWWAQHPGEGPTWWSQHWGDASVYDARCPVCRESGEPCGA